MKEVCVLVVLARGGEGAVTDVPLKKHESRLELINKISPNVQSRHNIWMVRKLPVILSNFLVLIDKKRTQIRFTRAFKFTVGRIKLIESAEQYNSGCSMVWNYQILPISHESCTHQMLWYFNVHATFAKRVFHHPHRLKGKTLEVSLLQLRTEQPEKFEEWSDDNISNNGKFQEYEQVSYNCFPCDARPRPYL